MKMNKLISNYTGLCACLLLQGCPSGVVDLQEYVETTKNKFQGSVEPLPQFKPPEIYAYRSERNPFEALSVIEQEAVVRAGANAPQDRALEPLEYFPLDALSMVGTLDRGGINWGLIKDSEGKIHRVKNDNYIGQNYGAITDVNSSHISITELIQDSSGLWKERVSQLHIGE
jgi:type IV pilus assembly protein PilP